MTHLSLVPHISARDLAPVSADDCRASDAMAPARGVLLGLALAIVLNTALAAGLWGCWTLSQSVARGSAFPVIPHAEATR